MKNNSEKPTTKEIKTALCQICNQTKPLKELIHAEFVRASMTRIIKEKFPAWKEDGYICYPDLNRFRVHYFEDTISKEKRELTNIEKDIVESVKEEELITTNVFAEFDSKQTIGNKISDKVAEFGGSWGFIIIFFAILAFWILLNSVALLQNHFDPYPFILLNLILSCIAAIQAPIIMMSQNRMEARDRLRSELDYKVNTKAEIEVRNLHEKIDHLVMNQWQRLLEIQQLQIELMEELLEKSKT